MARIHARVSIHQRLKDIYWEVLDEVFPFVTNATRMLAGGHMYGCRDDWFPFVKQSDLDAAYDKVPTHDAIYATIEAMSLCSHPFFSGYPVGGAENSLKKAIRRTFTELSTVASHMSMVGGMDLPQVTFCELLQGSDGVALNPYVVVAKAMLLEILNRFFRFPRYALSVTMEIEDLGEEVLDTECCIEVYENFLEAGEV